MRVIGGVAGGRPLRTVRGQAVRPTPDRVRESLFNMLAPHLTGCSFLDLYAGSGAVGIEALSRGARQAVFVDQNAQHLQVVARNLETTGLAAAAQLITSSATAAISTLAAAGQTFSVIFMDPPYGCGLVPETLVELVRTPLLCPAGVLVAEHHRRDSVPAALPAPGDAARSLVQVRRRDYGDVCLAFYRCVGGDPPESGDGGELHG